MKPMRLRPAATLAEIGVVAALYAAITIVLNPLSYGPLQLRVAEILKPLVVWEPHLIPAFVIGNFLSNLTSPFAGPWELIFMPCANLVGASLCYVVGRRSPVAGGGPSSGAVSAAGCRPAVGRLQARVRARFCLACGSPQN